MTAAIVAIGAAEMSRPADAFGVLLERFLAAQDVTDGSRSTYRRQLRQFAAWLTESGRMSRLSDLQREDILAYKEALLRSRKATTVGGYLSVVRKLFEWLETEKIYPHVARVKGPKKPKGFRRDSLTISQLRSALLHTERASLDGMRDYALFNLLARTGLRTIEVARALISDIRQEAGQAILWIQGKGRDQKDDFVILVDEALEPIMAYLRARGKTAEDAPLFASSSDRNRGESLTTRSISRIVKQALRRAGIDSGRLTAHSLRHTAISLALANGASLQQAQAMARHTDPKTTLIYAHNHARITSGAERHIAF